MHLDHTAQLVQIDIHPGGLQINSRSAWRCLFDTQTVGAVISDIEPIRLAPVPSPLFPHLWLPCQPALGARSVLTTFGHHPLIQPESLPSSLARDTHGRATSPRGSQFLPRTHAVKRGAFRGAVRLIALAADGPLFLCAWIPILPWPGWPLAALFLLRAQS